MKTSTDASDRIGLYGGFWTRFLLRLLGIFPAWFCAFMTRPLTVPFYLLAGRQRRAVIANLTHLCPGRSALGRWYGGYRVFLQFALTYLDRLWALHFNHPVVWEFEQGEWLQRQLESPGGILLFTVHSGNYDLGADYFTKHFRRPLHVVRIPERTEELQELRAGELNRSEGNTPGLRVHYAADEWNLGLELTRVLANGEVVAMQGDRLPASSPGCSLDYEGIRFVVPRGPLVLAQVSRVPCFPIFLTRSGRGRYRLSSGPPFYSGQAGTGFEEIGRAWLGVMAPFVRRTWHQWFVFEPVLSSPQPEVTRCGGANPQTLLNQCE